MEKESVRIVLTDEELDQINGGLEIVKKVDGVPFAFSVSSTAGKDEPGKNKIFN